MRDQRVRNPLRLPSRQYPIYLLWLIRYQAPLLSPLRLPVPPSRHFVEVLDFTAYFTLYVFVVQDKDCETVQVNVEVFGDFHRSLSRAHESALRLPSGDDVPLAKQ